MFCLIYFVFNMHVKNEHFCKVEFFCKNALKEFNQRVIKKNQLIANAKTYQLQRTFYCHSSFGICFERV